MEQRSQLLVFVPEGQRKSTEAPVDLQDRWVMRLLGLCCELFGGATSYGRGVGVWKDKRSDKVHWDRVTVVESWVDPGLRRKKGWRDRLAKALREMCRELHEEEVAYMIDGEWRAFGSKGGTRG